MGTNLESYLKSKHASNFFAYNKKNCAVFKWEVWLGPNARVVYIDGGFDLFHVGHVEVCSLLISYLYDSL
ncbi:putative ethanolamine-phosphate cytidylyltransferase [Helianthus anomalus]